MSEYDKIKGEIWKTIPGYEGRYAVSNFGRVKRLERDLQYVDRRKGKLCNMHLDEMLFVLTPCKGKLIVSLKGPEKKRSENRYVHQLVAESFVDNPNNLSRVKHLDGDVRNNKASNLVWA